uniref:Uncharacterized protein n=1 Tax=Zea mays TaxID=4577 RepID=C4IYD1_MAIZE|nr:unknown [Zea mays]
MTVGHCRHSSLIITSCHHSLHKLLSQALPKTLVWYLEAIGFALRSSTVQLQHIYRHGDFQHVSIQW